MQGLQGLQCLPSLSKLPITTQDNNKRRRYDEKDDHVRVAFVTWVGMSEWIRLVESEKRPLSEGYKMPPQSSPIELDGDITSVWVRQVKRGVPYDYEISNPPEIARGSLEYPEETYKFGENIFDKLSEKRAVIQVNVTVDVDKKELKLAA